MSLKIAVTNLLSYLRVRTFIKYSDEILEYVWERTYFHFPDKAMSNL